MDSLKGVLISPHKIFKKMDEFPRSRMQIYYYNRLARVMDLHIADPPTFELKESTSDSVDAIRGCYSWIDFSEMTKMRLVLDTCYLGVFHNKDEGDETHGYFKIFSKVRKEELKMKDAKPENMGLTSKPISELKDHEFNANFAKLCGQTLKQKISKKVGNIESWFANTVLSDAAIENLLDMATFKASASKVVDLNFRSRMSRKNAGFRTVESSKCLKNCMDLIKENGWIGPNFLIFIGELIKLKEVGGNGLRAYLFKKLQLGGVREIFVLDFISRLIVYFCEFVCRKMCGEVEGEMQTHSHDKLSTINKHFSSVKALRKNGPGETTSVYNSDDNTTWCQRFVMSLFGCILSQVVPEPFRTTIMHILNMCTEKKLQLPIELLEKFVENVGDRSMTDSGLNTLKEQFLGLDKTSQKLIDQQGTMLYNTSNFMQGIFHYTSSLVHSSYMMVIEDFGYKLMRSQDFGGKISWMVSSDDSWMATTLSHLEESKAKATYMACLISCVKTSNYPLICAMNSEEKSTSPTITPVMEFNSTWFANASVLSMSIKFVEACVRVACVSRMDDRQNTHSTLRSQLLQNSGSIELCNIIQHCQCVAHYTTLGSYIDEMFTPYAELCLQKPHPSAGFFMFEPELCVGMLGMSFSMFTACANSEEFLRHHLQLLTDKDAEVDELGQVRTKVDLPFGQSKKYKKFLTEIGYDPTYIKKTFEENPFCFIDMPKNSEDLKARMMEKCSDPSIADSFTFNTDSQLHSSATYVLTGRCLTVKMKNVEQVGSNKMTLLYYISNMKKFDGDIKLSHRLVLFNNLDFYTEFHESIEKLKEKMGGSKTLVMVPRARTKMLTISIPKNVKEMPISLMTAVKKVWFNVDSASEDLANRVFDHYRSVFTWLRPTMKQTLESEDCPFDSDDGVRLLKFIRSMAQTNRTVQIITTARNTVGKTDSLLEVIKCSQVPETEVKLGAEGGPLSSVGKRVTVNLLKYYQHNLSCAPGKGSRQSLMLNLLKSTPANSHDVRSLIEYMQRHDEIEARLELFKFLSVNPDVDFINLASASSSRGSVGWFERPQKLDPVTKKWSGYGLFTGVISGVPYQVSWTNKSSARILIGSVKQFDKIRKDLKPVLKSLEISPSSEVSASYLDVSSFRILSTNNGNCVPVFERIITPNTTNTGTYRIDVNAKIEICLVSNAKPVYEGQASRDVVLMKVKPRGDTIVRAPSDESKLTRETLSYISDVDYSWLNGKALSLIPALNFIEQNSTEDRSWAENSLRLRLEYHNIRPAAFLRQTQTLDDDVISVDSQDLGEDEKSEIGFFDFDLTNTMNEDNLDEEFFEMLNVDSDNYDMLFDMVYEDQMLIEEFAEFKNNADKLQPERRNAFWDKFIEKLKQTSGVEIMSQILSNSTTYQDIEIEALNRYSKALYAIMRGKIKD
jgi:hypothetical protein